MPGRRRRSNALRRGGPMTLHILRDLEQGSEEWHAARRGIVTASVVGKLITVEPPSALSLACPTCGATVDSQCLSAARKTPTPIKTVHAARTALAVDQPPVYAVADNDTTRAIVPTLAAERITGWTEDTAMTADMWRGVECEPYARDAYSQHYAPVTEVGFMRRDEDDWRLGYSPDGPVGDGGLIEIKAPRAKTHVLTILADEVPAQYMAQCQAGLLVSGRSWIDFVSFVAGMPLYRKRVEPNPEWFAAITAACVAFEANVAAIVADYEKRVADMPQTQRIDLEIKVA